MLLSDEFGGGLPRSTVAHLWATAPDAVWIEISATTQLGLLPGTDRQRR